MRQEERRAQTRAAIIREATRAFADQGYDAASLDSIAAAAGYSKGAVYGHFTSKREILLIVARKVLEEAGVRAGKVAEAVSAGEDPYRAARRYGDVEAGDAHAQLLGEIWCVSRADGELRALVTAHRRDQRARLASIFQESGGCEDRGSQQAEILLRLIDSEVVAAHFGRSGWREVASGAVD